MIILIEYITIISMAFLIIKEIIMPSISGRKVFPSFRREGKLKKDIELAKQTNYENKIEQQLEQEIYKK